MPDPDYAGNPPGCFHLLVGLVVIFIVALVLKSCF